MRPHLKTGKTGELLARKWLQERGDQILEVNWRYSHYEIDIISKRKDVLCFIEVKTRKSVLFGMPEEAVTTSKIRRMMFAAAAYQEKHPEYIRVQYDILSIILTEKSTAEFYLIEDISL